MRREFSKETKRKALDRSGGLCEGILPSGERCEFPVTVKKHFDHIIPDALGGPNDLTNCAVLCIACHDSKTRKIDVPIIAKAKRVSDKHNGIRKPSRLKSAPFRKSAPQRTASRPIERRT